MGTYCYLIHRTHTHAVDTKLLTMRQQVVALGFVFLVLSVQSAPTPGFGDFLGNVFGEAKKAVETGVGAVKIGGEKAIEFTKENAPKVFEKVVTAGEKGVDVAKDIGKGVYHMGDEAYEVSKGVFNSVKDKISGKNN